MKRTLTVLFALLLCSTAFAAGFVDDGLYRPARTKFTKVSVTIRNPRKLAGVVVIACDTNGTIVAAQDIGRKRIATFTDLPSPCWVQCYWYTKNDLHSPLSKPLVIRP